MIHDLIGFSIVEPTYTSESEPQLFEFMDFDLVPGIAEARTVEQMDEALFAYWDSLAPQR